MALKALYAVSIRIVSIISLPSFFNLDMQSSIIFSVFPLVPPTIIASTVGSDGKTSSALE